MAELSRMHPADVDSLVEKSTESEADYVRRIKLGEPSAAHRVKFTCAGCGPATGYGPPAGLASDG